MTHVFKPGRYKTRDGREAVVLCDDAPGNWPLVGYLGDGGSARWTKSGRLLSFASDSNTDLMPPEPEPVVRWVYLVEWHTGAMVAYAMESGQQPDTRSKVIARSRVVLTPGVFEDESTPSEYDRGWNDAIDAATNAVIGAINCGPAERAVRALKRSAP